MAKTLVLGLILVYLTQIGAANFFKKNLVLSFTRCHGQLSCAISEKTNNLILRKHSDAWTDGQTDRWTRVIS